MLSKAFMVVRLALFIVLCLVIVQVLPLDRPTQAQTEAQVTMCQRIDAPGQYVLTTDLADSPVELSFEPDVQPIYTAERGLTHACLEIVASDVSLDCQGHNLIGSEQDETAGIVFAGNLDAPLTGVSIANCTISAYQFGLYGEQLSANTITTNTFTRNTGTGLYLTHAMDIEVNANIAEGNDPDGFLLILGNNNTLRDNTAFYNRMRGITFEHCEQCVAQTNESYSNGVLGFAIYGSTGVVLENNLAHDNRYHGFAILHESGSASFTGNESFANDGSGFFLQGSRDNTLTENLSHNNTLDGISLFNDAEPNTFENNELRDNMGYGVFSDAPLEETNFASSRFAGNGLEATGSNSPDAIDWCRYTGFGENGPCDPVFEGGPNLKDPTVEVVVTETETPSPASDSDNLDTGEAVIQNARVVGEPIYYPSLGDLWMATWADDDQLYLSWGDGSGPGTCFPTWYPDYETATDTLTITSCEENDAFCVLWCNMNECEADQSYPACPLTDMGLAVAGGSVDDFDSLSTVAIDLPEAAPFFRTDKPIIDGEERYDKPASLLFVDGRLYMAGYTFFGGQPSFGFLAYSDDYGQTWTETPNSPWDATSNFQILMFINMGQAYALNEDGYVYALGINLVKEGEGEVTHSVYLARVLTTAIADYNAYEYFSGLAGDTPGWSANEADALPVDTLETVGQGSAIYHEGIDRYLFMTTTASYNPVPDEPFGHGALYEAPYPWGPWTKVAVLCFTPECHDESYDPIWTEVDDQTGGPEQGKYVAGFIPKDAGEDYVYFTIAGGGNHYQLQVGKLEFEFAP